MIDMNPFKLKKIAELIRAFLIPYVKKQIGNPNESI
jgi:hypothetical protein